MILENGIFHSTVFEGLPVIHGFTTRSWGNLGFGKKPGDPNVIANRRKLFETLNLQSRLHVQTQQIHSDIVVLAEAFQPGMPGDAAIASSGSYLLSILTADCVPALVYHPEKRIGAVIHAGWRGIYHDIVEKTLAKIPPGASAAIGPAIGVCCYEVSEDLANDFAAKFGAGAVLKMEGKKPHLDLVTIVEDRLIRNGVKELESARLCTFCHPELFFSYRRDGSSGRMMSFLAL